MDATGRGARKGWRMGDEYKAGSNSAGRRSSVVSRYSRLEGVNAYRNRRRRNKTVRIVVVVALLCILGGAAFLFGRQYIDYRALPFEVPGADMYESGKQDKQDESEEVVPTMQPVTISLVGAGDVVMNSAVVESGQTDSGSYSFGHLFGQLRGELERFDVRTVSQETSLAGSSFGFGYSVPLNAPQELGRAEVDAGFNVILRACDHALDTGRDGIHNELVWWHNEYPKIPIVGITEPDPENNPGLDGYVGQVYVYEKEGFKVAILNHSLNVPEEEQSVVSALVEEKINADVAQVRELGVDMIVACPHWGVENETEPSEEEHEFARIYANAGVDVIMGTNPRVLQRVEVLSTANGHKTLCFYSLGCLVSSLDVDNLLGGLAELTVHRDESGNSVIQSATLKPVVTHRAAGEEYSTYLASDYTDELAQSSWDGSLTPEYVSQRCSEVFGEEYDAEAGELRINLDATVPVE